VSQVDAPLDPAAAAGWRNGPKRKGFFTDTSLCIGCKACEVACKEWNSVPADGLRMLGSSYDNTGALGASTWRHVAFIEQRKPMRELPVRNTATTTAERAPGAHDFRWLMSSDVCKHCTHAACLDVCPTGALMRSEFGTVVIQADVCNGCGYCVPACPFGVIERRERAGRAEGRRRRRRGEGRHAARVQGERRARVSGRQAARERLEHLEDGRSDRHAAQQLVQEARAVSDQPGVGRVGQVGRVG